MNDPRLRSPPVEMWNVPSATAADDAATAESDAPFATTTLPGLPTKRMSKPRYPGVPVSRVDLRIWIVAGPPEQLQRYENRFALPEKSVGRFSIPCEGSPVMVAIARTDPAGHFTTFFG